MDPLLFYIDPSITHMLFVFLYFDPGILHNSDNHIIATPLITPYNILPQ